MLLKPRIRCAIPDRRKDTLPEKGADLTQMGRGTLASRLWALGSGRGVWARYSGLRHRGPILTQAPGPKPHALGSAKGHPPPKRPHQLAEAPRFGHGFHDLLHL